MSNPTDVVEQLVAERVRAECSRLQREIVALEATLAYAKGLIGGEDSAVVDGFLEGYRKGAR